MRGPARVALALGAAGTVYRAALVLAGAPPTNSDEATMGLMALHIAEHTSLPVFFYGQHYMGAIEAYLAAPLFALLGPSTPVLRLSTVVLYAAFLYAMFQLTRRLYTPWLAAVVVGLLTLGSDRVLKDQLIAGGGYPEVNALAAALLLGAVHLAGTPPVAGARRHTGYAAWGLGAGVALWADYLVVPYLLAAAALLLAFNRAELAGRAGALLLGGGLLGLAPVIAHDLTTPLHDNSVAVLLHLSGAGGSAPLVERLHGGVLLGVPLATGLCPPGRCGPALLGWGAGYVLLLGVAAALAVIALRAAREARDIRDGRPELVRQAGRLGLACAAALSIALYAKSPSAALTPVESARYLSCLLVSTPAVLWPLWSAATSAHRPRAVFATATLLGVALASGIATTAAVAEVPSVRAAERDQQRLIAALDAVGATRVYAEYWTCNRLTFATRERIVCATLRDDLRPGLDRYPPYRDMVAAARDPVYVLTVGSTVDATFAAQLARSGTPAQVTQVAGYHLYRPATISRRSGAYGRGLISIPQPFALDRRGRRAGSRGRAGSRRAAGRTRA